MRNLIYIPLLIILFSCQNKSLKTELINAYKISAENEKDTLQIEKLEILKTQNVDFDYVQNIKINNLKYSINLNKKIIQNLKNNVLLYEKNISNRKKIIELDNKNKDKHLKELEYDKQKLESTKLNINKTENKIALTLQKIVLIRAEFGYDKRKYELIDYVFKGKINIENRIDTMSILKDSERNIKFVKNNMFTDYKGK
jgi:hypothetical protein